MNIYERLSKIENIIRQPSFLNNEETGNEIGYYIFDYNPKDELLVILFPAIGSSNHPERYGADNGAIGDGNEPYALPYMYSIVFVVC